MSDSRDPYSAPSHQDQVFLLKEGNEILFLDISGTKLKWFKTLSDQFDVSQHEKGAFLLNSTGLFSAEFGNNFSLKKTKLSSTFTLNAIKGYLFATDSPDEALSVAITPSAVRFGLVKENHFYLSKKEFKAEFKKSNNVDATFDKKSHSLYLSRKPRTLYRFDFKLADNVINITQHKVTLQSQLTGSITCLGNGQLLITVNKDQKSVSTHVLQWGTKDQYLQLSNALEMNGTLVKAVPLSTNPEIFICQFYASQPKPTHIFYEFDANTKNSTKFYEYPEDPEGWYVNGRELYILQENENMPVCEIPSFSHQTKNQAREYFSGLGLFSSQLIRLIENYIAETKDSKPPRR